MACVVSHKYRFIFIHVPRTGGSSFLSPYSVYWKYLGKDDFVPTWHKKAEFFKRMFPEKWNEYFKFAFVRDPIDRMVSMWLIKAGPKVEFAKFLQQISIMQKKVPFIRPQSFWIGDGSELDHVARFERHDEECAWIAGKVGLPLLDIGIVRVTPGKLHYINYYTDETLEMAYSICKKDMENFGYGRDSD